MAGGAASGILSILGGILGSSGSSGGGGGGGSSILGSNYTQGQGIGQSATNVADKVDPGGFLGSILGLGLEAAGVGQKNLAKYAIGIRRQQFDAAKQIAQFLGGETALLALDEKTRKKIEKNYPGGIEGFRQIEGIEEPFREREAARQEAALSGLQSLLDEPLGVPDPFNVVNPAFQLLGQEGVDLLNANSSITGSAQSGPNQLAQGRFLAGLAGPFASELINANLQLQNIGSQRRGLRNQLALGLLGTSFNSPATQALQAAEIPLAAARTKTAGLGGAFSQGPSNVSGLAGAGSEVIDQASGLLGSLFSNPNSTTGGIGSFNYQSPGYLSGATSINQPQYGLYGSTSPYSILGSGGNLGSFF